MEFQSILKKMKQNWIVSSAVTAMFGLILVLFPGISLRILSYIIGAIAIIMGVTRTARYFKQDHTYPFLFQSDLVAGLLAVGLGLFMITNPDTVITILPHIFGILLVGCGVGNILRAVDAKKAGFSQWGLLLALAVISILLGGLIIANPFAVIEGIVTFVGACMIYEGVTDIVTTLVVGKRIETWKKSL